MGLRLAASVALAFSVAAHAQPGDTGPFAAVGGASPERALLPERTDPSVTVGWRFAGGLDVGLAGRVRTRESIDRVSGTGVPGTISRVTRDERTRAAALSVGLVRPAGPLRLTARATAAYDVLDQTFRTRRYPDDPGTPFGEFPVEAESARARFVHAAASVIVALPVRRGRGRLAPGVGVAVSTAPVADTYTTRLAPPSDRWAAFAHLPTSVEVGPVGVTLLATAGVASGQVGLEPLFQGGLRVEL